MNKTLLAFLIAAVVMTVSAHSVDDLKNIYRADKCLTDAVDPFKPELQAQVAKLRLNKEDVAAKVEILSLVRKIKAATDGCNKAVEPQVGDALEALGYGFLLSSNCTKDLGIFCLIGDDIVQDPSSIVDDIVVAIILVIMGRQGLKDCSQFINFIIG